MSEINADGTPSTQLAVLRTALKQREQAEAQIAAATAALGRLLPGPLDRLVVAGPTYDRCVFRLRRDESGLSVTVEEALADYALDDEVRKAQSPALRVADEDEAA